MKNALFITTSRLNRAFMICRAGLSSKLGQQLYDAHQTPSCHLFKGVFVKLQFKLNSSVQVGQGVDFVFPLSQEEEEEQEEQEEEPPPKSTTSRHTRRLRFGMLT